MRLQSAKPHPGARVLVTPMEPLKDDEDLLEVLLFYAYPAVPHGEMPLRIRLRGRHMDNRRIRRRGT